MKKEVGARIKIIRLGLDISLEEFAKKLEMTPQYLNQIEKGQIYLSIEKLKILCDITHLSSDYILFGKPEPKNLYTTKMLRNLSNEQIDIGCEMLKHLAYFIKGE